MVGKSEAALHDSAAERVAGLLFRLLHNIAAKRITGLLFRLLHNVAAKRVTGLLRRGVVGGRHFESWG